MATGQRVEVVIDGNVGPLRQKLREGIGSLQRFGNEAEHAFTGIAGPLSAVTSKFLAFTAILAGGAFAGEAIRETVQFNKEVNQLARTLGVSATEATAWNVALGDIYQDSDALIGAMGKVNRLIAEDEEKLNRLGIATRDANGNLRAQGDIFLDIAKHLNTFREGTDRNVEGARIFGKTWADVAPIMKLTADRIDEAKQKADELGLTVTKESQGRVDAYRAAMNDVGDVMLGIKNVIGQALMPVLTRLGEWFSSIGPNLVAGFRGSVASLVSIFWGLKNAVVIAWEAIIAMIYSVTEPIRSLGSALYKLVTGDFKGAQEEMMNWPDRVAAAWKQAWENMVASSQDTADKITEAWGFGGTTPTDKPKSGKGASPEPDKNKPKSQLAYYEQQLALEQQFLALAGETRLINKQQELEYWQTILRTAKVSADDRIAITRKVAGLEVEIRKRTAEQQQRIEADQVDASERLQLAQLEGKRLAAQALRDNDEITKAQLLQMEIQFDQEQRAIQLAALQERLRLLEADPNTNPVEMARIKAQVLQIEQEFQNKRVKVLGELQQQGGLGGVADSFGTSFSKAFSDILTGARGWYQAMGDIFRSVRDAFISAVITEPLKAAAAGWAKQLAMRLGFLEAETVAQSAASGEVVGAKLAETTTVTTANAVQAGSGAAASQAQIPYIGPILALAAMATIFAAVSAMGSKVKSARSGYDIPRGINPLTQLHEEEMVLPKGPANTLRSLEEMLAGGAGAGGGGQGGGTVIYNDHSGRLTPRQIRENARILADEMTKLHRHGWRPA